MAVQGRQDGAGVPLSAAKRRPGLANTPGIRASRASRPASGDPDGAELRDGQNEVSDQNETPGNSRVRSRGSASGSGVSDTPPNSPARRVRSTPVEPEGEDVDLDYVQSRPGRPDPYMEDHLTSELTETLTDPEEYWEPDALDDQIQEELAEEFERARVTETRQHAASRATRRRRIGTEAGPGATGPASMPVSGVVPPVASDDGMHTMDGEVAVPVTEYPGRDSTEDGVPPAQARYRRNMDPTQIYRGRSRLALIRDLAMGEWTDQSIAQSIGVPYDVIVDFRITYEQEINEVRLALASQLAIESAGMWISKRQNRIAEMQEDYEDIDLVLAVMRENTKIMLHNGIDGSDSQLRGDAFDTNLLLGSRRHQNLLRSKLAIMKAVSDELSPRNKESDSKDDSNTIRYVIEQDGAGDDIIGSLT